MLRISCRPKRLVSCVAVLLAVSFTASSCSDQSATGVPRLTPSDAALSLDGSPGAHRRLVSPSGADVGNCATSPCRTIGYAVSKADPGDEISVARGTYHETATITKRLALVGHDATIDAAGLASPPNGVVISGAAAAGTVLRGFTITNAGLEGVFVNKTSHVTIEANRVVKNDAYGPFNPLCVDQPDDCGEAIHLQSVTHSVVRDNLVQNNVGGILLTDEDGPTFGNLIVENRVLDNTLDCGITLASHHFDLAKAATADVAGVYRNLVLRNVANGNGAAGIGVFAGPPGAAAWENTVAGNTAKGNGFAGIMIHSHTPSQYVDKNVIVNNVVANNNIDDDNPFSDKKTGISVFSAVVPIPQTVIADNRISDEYYGIITVKAVKVSGLRSNKFAKSVTVPVSTH
jgi:parallel beta-helix repeat protein